MAARKLKPHHQDEQWKYYVYQFKKLDNIVYVGKGCKNRFDIQSKRFLNCQGEILAFFKTEKDALDFESFMIKKHKPPYNKSQMPKNAEPWKYSLLPEKHKDFYIWCEALGNKQMIIRVLLSKSWTALQSYGVDVKKLLSKLENCEVFNGLRC